MSPEGVTGEEVGFHVKIRIRGLWALLLIFCGTLGRSLPLSGPPFLHLKSENVGLNQELFPQRWGS